MKGIFEIFLGLAVTFASVGLWEAILKPLAYRVMRRRVDSIPPLFWAMFDAEVAALIENGGTSEQLKDATRSLLSELTGEEWTEESLRPVLQRADFGAFLDRFAGFDDEGTTVITQADA
jgi:hypothetical protein